MNAKLLLKTVFLLLILLLLVLIGRSNPHSVSFALPPLLSHPVSQPAGIMYFIFFAVGVLCGTIMTAGGGKKSGSSSSPKPSKSK